MTTDVKMRSLAALLRPRSVAFVGISARGGGSGAKMLDSTCASGFTGEIWPVHPNAAEISGLPCFTSLSALPGVPDCVVISVPATAVLGIVEDMAALGIPSALVVSEGFADSGNDEGRERQRQLVILAEQHNMAIAGPNCMGISTFQHHYAATMADIPPHSVAGGISLITQSGGLLNAVAELCANRGIGLNYLASIGNQAVVDMADYIDFLAEDNATSVIALIMEGVKDGRHFRRAIERASRVKPVVVLKLGRSASGQAATLAHTGTLAGRHEAFAALFTQTGVALVESVDELVETAGLFARAPLPAGDRVCLLTVSGGATSMIGDLGERTGINFPPISDATNQQLGKILGIERQFGNPLDTIGMPRLIKDGNMRAILDVLMADDGIDIIGLVLGMRLDGAKTHQTLIDELAQAVADAKKPLMVVSFMSNSLTRVWRSYVCAHTLPLLEDLERGMKAIRHLVNYAAARRRSGTRAHAVHTSSPRGFMGERVLTEAESKKILGQAGLPVTKEQLACSPREAAALFAEIGGKVALKIQSPDIPHKSDIGGVYLGAQTADEVEQATTQVLDNAKKACPNARIEGVLVQEMVTNGIEFLLGMTYDDQFGPIVVCGAGGVTVEVFKDTSVRLPHIDSEDARGMLSELKAKKFLEGFRGTAPGDIDAFVDCIVRFGEFVAETDGQFSAIDLNPVFVCPQGSGVKIADALIITRTPAEE
jgi:acetate---CoA ligase (ADP-forming)